uniref:Uncharacterized protein n=1 Tax=Erpetoichthys calabaricus TaxID=27687 RepID=A0A8C4T5G1_ERPCA
MAHLGRSDEFKPGTQWWLAHTERSGLFFVTNSTAQDKRVATLLSVMSTYRLLRNRVQLLKPKDKTFEQIVEILKGHFESKLLVIAERFHSKPCSQKASETETPYAVEPKPRAVNCDEAHQHRRSSETNLTFARAFEVSLSMEMADRDTQQLRYQDGSQSRVHKVGVQFRSSNGEESVSFLHIRICPDCQSKGSFC